MNLRYIKAPSAIDGYKVSHKDQYPEGTEEVYSNFTPRSTRLFKGLPDYDNKILVFGTRATFKLVLELWDDTFFKLPKKEALDYIYRRLKNYLGTSKESLLHFADLHDLGYLPIEVKSLPEGIRVKAGIPVFTIKNTLKEFYWVTNMLETVISTEAWQPMTSATTAYEYRRLAKKYSDETCDNDYHLPFQLHDFSMRGLEGVHPSAKSSAGHLIGSGGAGTDTLPAIDFLEYFYGADSDKELVGCSVPASEHSTVTMNIQHYMKQGLTQVEAETATLKRLVTRVYPTGIFSYVSDSYDFWSTLNVSARELKDDILARGEITVRNGAINPDIDGGVHKVVFRPDSGNPVDIICGLDIRADDDNFSNPVSMANDTILDGYKYFNFNNTYYEVVTKEYEMNKSLGGIIDPEFNPVNITTPEAKGAIEVLWDIFGGHVNDKGYKVLNPKVGLIYGDSITLARALDILKRLKAKGFASSNVVFGIGSYTYQFVTRDTLGFAMKATSGIVAEERIMVYKDPKTGDGVKKSAKGLLFVKLDGDEYTLLDNVTEDQEQSSDNQLSLLLRDGVWYKEETYKEIRERLN